jgi:hypothetical protein
MRRVSDEGGDRHLSDDELQVLAEGDQARVTVPPHLVACGACREALATYHRIGREVGALPRPLPPADFTASLLARLPPEPPPLAVHDLAAVALAAGAALAAAILFGRADGVTRLWNLIGNLPGRAFTEALVATSLGGRDQIALLLFLATAALVLGVALWRVLARPQRVVA